jgi:transcriptional regulator with XRE-family HTH domain
MRAARRAAGVSLRDLERRGRWRRSTISQVETATARPSRELVRWYDTELGTDGLLLSMYAEARSRQLLGRYGRAVTDADRDVVRVVETDPPAGVQVERSAPLRAHLTLVNDGRTVWRGRRLRRMGAYTGARLICSPPEVDVPGTAPGERADVMVELRAPELPGSVVAYWSMVDEAGRESDPHGRPIAVRLVVA